MNDGTSLLRLIVEKDFRKLEGVTDPKWVNQMVQEERSVGENRVKKLYDGDPFAQREWKLDATEAAWRKAKKQCEQVMHVGVKKHEDYGECKGCLGKNFLKE